MAWVFPGSSAGSQGGWDAGWVDGQLLVPPVSGGTSQISDLCHIDIPQENGGMWKCMTSQLREEDFLLEEEGVDSPERCGQNQLLI